MIKIFNKRRRLSARPPSGLISLPHSTLLTTLPACNHHPTAALTRENRLEPKEEKSQPGALLGTQTSRPQCHDIDKRGIPPRLPWSRHGPRTLLSKCHFHSSTIYKEDADKILGAAAARKGDARTFISTAMQRQAMEKEEYRHDELAAPPPLNPAHVPLTSPFLRNQLFPSSPSPFAPPTPSIDAVKISLDHLHNNGLLPDPASAKSSRPPDSAVNFTLPKLQGETISHHFHALGRDTAEPYLSLAKSFASLEDIAPMPEREQWKRFPGWTYYGTDGSFEAVDYPQEGDEAMVFDVETLPFQGSHFPIMAAAVGKEGWYAWCSPWLTGHSDSPNHLIPFGATTADSSSTPSTHTERSLSSDESTLFEKSTTPPRLLIGHNVLFDRARVATEYTLRRPSTRWIDTLSLHVAVSGLTNPQRPVWMKYRKGLAATEDLAAAEALESNGKMPRASKDVDEEPGAKTWKELASINSLVEVARLHCGIIVDKSLRETLIDPATTIEDVRNDFDDLMAYCAKDVKVTYDVYKALLPKFLDTCPHPVSFSGVLLMSQPVLPVDYRWPQYLERAERTYSDRRQGVRDAIRTLAEDARDKFDRCDENGRFEWQDDVWLRQLDWSPKKARRLPGDVQRKRSSATIEKLLKATEIPQEPDSPYWHASLKRDSDGLPIIPLQSPLAALLFQATWRGFPLVFTDSHGWLFAVTHAKNKKFVPDTREEVIEPDELGSKDSAAAAIEKVVLYTVPSRGVGRCRVLITPGQSKQIENEVLESPFDEFRLAAAVAAKKSGSDFDEVQAFLRSLANKALGSSAKKRLKDKWLRQLDWSPAGKTPRRSLPLPPERAAAIERRDLIWPQWYWDLDVPGKGLDISIGKRTAQLLLKLRWNGHPIVHSKEHGWVYRIPKDDQDKPELRGVTSVDFKLPADLDLFEDASFSRARFVKLPHPDGQGKNVGSALSRPFVAAFEEGLLTSQYPAAADALSLNASCSYWTSARERIMGQMVVWGGNATLSPPTPSVSIPPSPSQTGLILPQVIPMGTVTRRAVERTWLTASNAKKNRVGSELKSMVFAPPGYAIVGADVDSEELWICSVMGDAQFGMHGATAVGWMTLEGTKAAGTDLHSKSASILGITRDNAKAFNYSRIYGAGLKHAVTLLLKCNPTLSTEQATALVKNLYASTKGVKNRTGAFGREFWHGGTESFVFNKLEEIARKGRPRTPALGCGLTTALRRANLPAEGRSKAGEGYLPSRINWVVQSSGVDYLHLLLVSMEYLSKRFEIDARYMISVHDEVRYLVKEEDKYRAAMALQIANVWARTLFSYRLQIGDLPQSCAFFSAVDVDHCFRKEVNMSCVTPSNPDAIAFGESLEIGDSLRTTSGGSLFRDGRSMDLERDLPTLPAVESLSEEDALGEAQRPSGTAFLAAQITRSAATIRKLWSEVKPSGWEAESWKSRAPRRDRIEQSIFEEDLSFHDLSLKDIDHAHAEVSTKAAPEEKDVRLEEDDLDVPEEIEEEGFSQHAIANKRSHA